MKRMLKLNITKEEDKSMVDMDQKQLGIQWLSHLDQIVFILDGRALDILKILTMSLILEWILEIMASLINICFIVQWSIGLNKEKFYLKLRIKRIVDHAGLTQQLQQLKVSMLNIIELISLKTFQAFQNNNLSIVICFQTLAAWVANKFMLLTTPKITD